MPAWDGHQARQYPRPTDAVTSRPSRVSITTRVLPSDASEPVAELHVLVPSTGPNPQRFVCGPHLLAGCVTTSGGHEYEKPLDVVPAAGAYGETLHTARWFVGTSELLVVVAVTAKIHASPSAAVVARALMSSLLTSMRLPVPSG